MLHWLNYIYKYNERSILVKHKRRFLLFILLLLYSSSSFSSSIMSNCGGHRLLLLLVFFFLVVESSSAQLSATFYDQTCSKALSTIQSAVDSAVSAEARMGASLLRLHFHDCFVNASPAVFLSFLKY